MFDLGGLLGAIIGTILVLMVVARASPAAARPADAYGTNLIRKGCSSHHALELRFPSTEPAPRLSAGLM